LVFDWNGNFKSKLVLAQDDVSFFTVDEKRHLLYGFDMPKEKIYKYDLNNVFPR